MAQTQLPLQVRLWRWGVLPIVIGAVLVTVAPKIASWFPGGPHFLVIGAVLGFYLGFLARTWRGLLIGVNGGALCGLVSDRFRTFLDASVQMPTDMEHMDPVVGLIHAFSINFSISFSVLFLSLGILSGFFRHGRSMFLEGCLRGLASGILCWFIRHLTIFDFVFWGLGYGLWDELTDMVINLFCLVPLLLFSPLLKPPVEEIGQQASADEVDREEAD